MQREIKKKTITYGVAALLLATILTAVVYNFGVQPFVPFATGLKTFTSFDELKSFLSTNMQEATQRFKRISVFQPGASLSTLGTFATFATPSAVSAPDYSTTNVQVAGVDEADIVKTDGQYLYVASGSNVYIINASQPSQAEIVSKISINQTYQASIYLDGDKLVVLEKGLMNYPLLCPSIMVPSGSVYEFSNGVNVLANVYDISNKTNPVLMRTVSFNGTLVDSRMIGNYVYLVVNQIAATYIDNVTNLDVLMPQFEVDNRSNVIQPTAVKYLSLPDVAYYFTTVIAINVVNDAQQPTYETMLTGATASIYVSLNNMYLTIPDTTVWGTPTSSNLGSQETIICRAELDNEKVIFEAQGNVPGYVLNQYSMDEYNGYFRVATTRGWGSESVNYLTVLDMNLSIVGSISNIAPGERIYSARFIGDRCYLDTFLQVDPFYVIDLGNPSKPKILGSLNITGFSGYLHPYDENHIIGIGENATAIAEDGGSYALFQGVQLSLFDVSNVSNPIRVANYSIGDRGSGATVLQDNKAFLFDAAKNLLVIPVSVALINQTEHSGAIPSYAYGDLVFQGAYVFNVTLTAGFVLKGTVTHIENSSQLWNSNYYVTRALYIENILYTVSNAEIRINNLQDLSLVKTIDLN